MAKQPLTFRRVTHPAAMVPLKAVERGLVAQVMRGPNYCGAARALMHTLVRATRTKQQVAVTGVYLAELHVPYIDGAHKLRIAALRITDRDSLTSAVRTYDPVKGGWCDPMASIVAQYCVEKDQAGRAAAFEGGAMRLVHVGGPGRAVLTGRAYTREWNGGAYSNRFYEGIVALTPVTPPQTQPQG